jgi:hypothetical protein
VNLQILAEDRDFHLKFLNSKELWQKRLELLS